MNTSETTTGKEREPYSAHVRLTEEEHTRLEEDSKLLGQSIPKLLKLRYFKSPRVMPLMSKEDQKVMAGQLGRIGNNVNQIARHLNQGFRAGFNDDLDEVVRQVTGLMTFLNSTFAVGGRR